MRKVWVLGLAGGLLASCGGTADPATAETCEQSVEIYVDLVQEYLDVVAELPPSDPITDAAIEAGDNIQDVLGATQVRVSELNCADTADFDELEELFCDLVLSLDTGTYGKQWLSEERIDLADDATCDS